MSRIKFVKNKVYNYVQGKSIFQIAVELFAFGFLAPLAFGGIAVMIYAVIFQGAVVDFPCGICY